MDTELRCEALSGDTEPRGRKPWESPVVEVLPLDQTKGDFIAITDATSFFS